MAKKEPTAARGARTATPTPDVIDVGTPASQELALAQNEGIAIKAIIERGLDKFYQGGDALEARAAEDLSVAKNWRVPTSLREDETIVMALRQNSVEKKAIEEYWTVTSMISRFHKRLVARRERAIALRDEYARIGNNLHLEYKRAEERRAEEARRRQEDEDRRKAEERRQLELAALEREALKREAESPELSAREQRFLEFYLAQRSPNGPDAAKYAGYRDPDAAAVKLLQMPKIKAALEARREADAIRRQAAAKKVAPLIVEETTPEPAQVARGTVVTWNSEITDERALINAVIAGQVPADILCVHQPKVNEHIRAVEGRLSWPGVRVIKKETVR